MSENTESTVIFTKDLDDDDDEAFNIQSYFNGHEFETAMNTAIEGVTLDDHDAFEELINSNNTLLMDQPAINVEQNTLQQPNESSLPSNNLASPQPNSYSLPSTKFVARRQNTSTLSSKKFTGQQQGSYLIPSSNYDSTQQSPPSLPSNNFTAQQRGTFSFPSGNFIQQQQSHFSLSRSATYSNQATGEVLSVQRSSTMVHELKIVPGYTHGRPGKVKVSQPAQQSNATVQQLKIQPGNKSGDVTPYQLTQRNHASAPQKHADDASVVPANNALTLAHVKSETKVVAVRKRGRKRRVEVVDEVQYRLDRDRNNELVKKTRQKKKEKERATAEAIEAGEKKLKEMEGELGVLKKYMAVHNALQDKNPAMFEFLKEKLQERNVI